MEDIFLEKGFYFRSTDLFPSLTTDSKSLNECFCRWIYRCFYRNSTSHILFVDVPGLSMDQSTDLDFFSLRDFF